MKKHKGFTLVELMIVVAIIGLVSAIAFPSFDAYMKKGRRTDALHELARLADLQERFYPQGNTYSNSLSGLGTGLVDPHITPGGNYSITTTGGVAGFVLTAVAIAGQANDDDCKTLTLNSIDQRTATDSGGGDSTSKCWKK